MKTPYFALGGLAVLCILTTGCNHTKAVQAATVPPPVATAPPIQVPPPSVLTAQAESLPPQEPETPAEDKTADNTKQTPAKPQQHRPAPPPAQKPAPVQSAASGAAPADVIGQLSTGGDASAHARDEAAAYLDSVRKRAASLSPVLVNSHQPAVAQVRDFLNKAAGALKSGDIAGANNLTTKARLLLDDIQR